MLTLAASRLSSLLSFATVTWMAFQPAQAHAAALGQDAQSVPVAAAIAAPTAVAAVTEPSTLAALPAVTPPYTAAAPSAAVAATPGAAPSAGVASSAPCALLKPQLRWHEPFFGLGTWPEVAQEALARTSPDCRAAIAAGKAPEVATALRELAQHAVPGDHALQRFVYRLTCQLRVPEARPQILAGLHEPAVYADCADALFSMDFREPEALKLRERYMEGLRQEPLKTHLPSALLRPPYAERLAPVLAAYDQAQLPGRDAVYRAVCQQPEPRSPEVTARCAGLTEREPEWVQGKLLRGDFDGGFSHLSRLPPEQLPRFTAFLQKFNAEERPGRDRLYQVLCARQPAPTGELGAACDKLLPRQEPKWLARNNAQRLQSQVDLYYLRGRVIAGMFLGVSLLLFAYGVLDAQRRRLRAQS
ncbi:MAG TPA: hypothetical protein PLW65_03810 [Pseudomonadota bacterium]|nr:hypothetical protein [Pseudomonadota bacterium]